MEPVTKNLPVIAMRGLNVFPRMNTSFDLERPISVHALERAMENGEEIFLVTQREIGVEQPEEKDLYEIGTVARVTQILRVSDRVLRVICLLYTSPALSGQTGYPRRAAPAAEIAAHERDSAPRDRSYRHGAGH